MSRVAVSFNRPLFSPPFLGLAVASCLGAGYGFGALLHMQAIIELQQTVRSELAASRSDKDGDQAQAPTPIDQAIAEVSENAGLAAAH